MRCWLLTYIEQAFHGVTLGVGMTIYDGESLDCYGDPNEELLATTAERLDWRRVPAADLYQRPSAITYLDSKGLRFYSPAIMSTILRDEDLHGIMTDSWFWTLDGISKTFDARGAPYRMLYNRSQRAAIIRFVKFHIYNTRYGRSDELLLETLGGLRSCADIQARG